MIPQDSGIKLVYPDESGITLTNRAGRRCSYIQGASLYFRVGDAEDDDTGSWRDAAADHHFRIYLLYLDIGTETIQVGYTADGTTETVETVVTKGDTGEWLPVLHTLAATARTAHTLYADFGSADFRLYSDGEIYVAALALFDTDLHSDASWLADLNRTNILIADLIVANTITADKLSVATLSSISANLGTVTAGVLDGVTVYAGGAGHPVTLNSSGMLLSGDGSAHVYVLDGVGSVAAQLTGATGGSASQLTIQASGKVGRPDAEISLVVADLAGADAIFALDTDNAHTAYYANLYSLTATLSGLLIGASGIPNAMLDVRGNSIINLNSIATPLPAANTNLQITGANSVSARETLDSYATNGAIGFRRANGTAGGLSGLAANDIIGVVSASGYDNVSAYSAVRAQIRLVAAEAWSNTAQGTYLSFLTTPKTTTAVAEGMRLQDDGSLTLLSHKIVSLAAGAAAGEAAAFDQIAGPALFTGGGYATVPAGVTRYPTGSALSANVIPLGITPLAGKLSAFYAETDTGQPAGGTLVYTLYSVAVGGALSTTGLVITVAAGGARNVYSDTTHTYTCSAGEMFAIGIKNNDGANPSAQVGGMGVKFSLI